MMVLISYDVSTTSPAGKKRLRKVAKECQNHAQRVQNSVFEGELLESQAIKLKAELDMHIRDNKDSVILFKSRSKRWMEKEFLGMIEDDKTDNFL